VETYLRMTGLPHQTLNGFYIFKAPKGKLPFIEDNGRLIADSGLIIDHLKQIYGDPLDNGLSKQERAVSLAFTRLMEEHLYWAALIQPRWIETEGWAVTLREFFKGMPYLLRFIIPFVARHGLKKQMHGHGMGRHNREEVHAMACADITALADYLGDKPFFHGDKPSSIDATAYAFIANIISAPIESPAKRYVLGLANLTAYCLRMKATYYADKPQLHSPISDNTIRMRRRMNRTFINRVVSNGRR
jgi:glutathione S-transferase